MKRSFYIGITILYDIIISMIATDLGITTTGNVIVDTPTDISIFTAIGDIFDSFGDLLTFNITAGFPAMMVIIFIYIPNIILFWVVVTLIFNRN